MNYDNPIEPFPEYAERIRRERTEITRQGIVVTTCSSGPISRTRRFTESTTDELRALVQPIGHDVGRDQLLALCRNRWPCGYWVETEDFLASRANEVYVLCR